MRRIGQLLVFIGLGWGLAWLLSVDVTALSHSDSYKYGAYLLLAIGLYGATYGIDLRQARADRKIIVGAVTIGVVFKALLIGVVLALAWRDPLFLILGVAVAQIDPLSVAALMGDKRMSARTKNVLAAWSSFDDPFTVVLAIYAAAVAVNTFGLGNAPPSRTDPLLLYAFDLGGNLVFAAAAWVLWRLIGHRPWQKSRAARPRLAGEQAPLGRAWPKYVVLLGFLAGAVATGWMLAIAIIGLFARPAALERLIPRITEWALYLASIALGMLLIDGISVWQGITLGAAAFLAQAIVAVPLTRGMPATDRWHLAAAQQNGITAVVLALTLEVQFDGVVAVVAPAIIVANLIHFAANKVIDLNNGHRFG